MTRGEQVRQISHLLLCTDDAHRSYAEKVRAAEPQDGWADWYAEYLIGHGLDNILGEALPTDRLGEVLKESRQEDLAKTPSPLWAERTARRVVRLLEA